MGDEVQEVQLKINRKPPRKIALWNRRVCCWLFYLVMTKGHCILLFYVYTPSQWGSPSKKPARLRWLWRLSLSRGPVRSSARVRCAAWSTKITFIQPQYKSESEADPQYVVNDKGKYFFIIKWWEKKKGSIQNKKKMSFPFVDWMVWNIVPQSTLIISST